MKKLLLFLWCLFLSNNYGKAQISIHTAQIEAFHNLMSYVEEKAGGKLACKNVNEIELQTAFDKNINDSKLNALIDSLLTSSAQYFPQVIENVNAQLSSEKVAKGREAYKVAFTILPDFCINMTAGMPETWVEYWNNEYRKRVENTITELKANIEEKLENIKSELKVLLPDEVDMNAEVNIHIVVDGNRGGYQFDKHILMDIIYGDLTDFSLFISVLKHEMHHAYYRKWLERFVNKERNEVDNYLYDYQSSFIFEGVAQRLDYEAYGYEHKQVYANKELINELFEEWVTLFRAIKGDSSETTISIYKETAYEKAIERGKKYYPDKNYRPYAHYLLSYHIYNLILEVAGQEKLKYVIENPDKLLLAYNAIHTDSMIVPLIPDDILRIWEENF